jgi:hypothetical protein
MSFIVSNKSLSDSGLATIIIMLFGEMRLQTIQANPNGLKWARAQKENVWPSQFADEETSCNFTEYPQRGCVGDERQHGKKEL